MLLKKKENKGNMGLSEDKYPVTDFSTRLPDSSISVADPLMAEYYTHRSPIYDALIDDLLKNNAVDEANDKALTEYEYASPSKDHNTTSLNTVITNADSTAVPLKNVVPEREVA